jgi:endonuclease G
LKEKEGVSRDNSRFTDDAHIPELFRAYTKDYTGSGYDRGHMSPAADALRSQQAMDETFLMTNIAPQIGPGFNRQCKYLVYLSAISLMIVYRLGLFGEVLS